MYGNDGSDRRQEPRARVKVRLEVTDLDTGRHNVLHTNNLSVGGARCTALRALTEGAVVQGHLYLPLSEAGRDIDVALPVRARVLRCHQVAGGTEFALTFDAMTDMDRAELASYLFAWLADDSLSHQDELAGSLR